jgi:hypothetical protein
VAGCRRGAWPPQGHPALLRMTNACGASCRRLLPPLRLWLPLIPNLLEWSVLVQRTGCAAALAARRGPFPSRPVLLQMLRPCSATRSTDGDGQRLSALSSGCMGCLCADQASPCEEQEELERSRSFAVHATRINTGRPNSLFPCHRPSRHEAQMLSEDPCSFSHERGTQVLETSLFAASRSSRRGSGYPCSDFLL